MTEQLNHTSTRDLSDSQLLNLVRNGDQASFGVLWERHRSAGERAARSITSTFEPDDLVQEAFTRIYSALMNGKGPTEGFRSYLYATLRSVSMNWAAKHETTVDLSTQENYLFTDEDLASLTEDKRLTVRAFQGLPSDWKTVLWYTEIEGMTPAEVAPLLGIAPRAVSALAFRAREGLRENWLTAHLNGDAQSATDECKWAEQHLASYTRDSLSAKRTQRMQAHLAECANCSLLLLELSTVGESLKGILLPLILGITPGVAALWGTGTAGATTALMAGTSVLGGATTASGGLAASGTPAGATLSAGAGVGAGAGSSTGAGSTVASGPFSWLTGAVKKFSSQPTPVVAGGLTAGLVVVAVAVAAAVTLGRGQEEAPLAAPEVVASEGADDSSGTQLSTDSLSEPVDTQSPTSESPQDDTAADSTVEQQLPSVPTVPPTHTPTVPTTESSDPGNDTDSEPTTDPTVDPTVDPTDEPTVDPTTEPTDEPTVDPTVDPTDEPTVDPTVDPTDEPTDEPTPSFAPLELTSESVPDSQVMPRFSGTAEPGSVVQVFLAANPAVPVSDSVTATDGTWVLDVLSSAPTGSSQKYVIHYWVDGELVSQVPVSTTYEITELTRSDFLVCKVFEDATNNGYIAPNGTLFTNTPLANLVVNFTIKSAQTGRVWLQFNEHGVENLSLSAGEGNYRVSGSATDAWLGATNSISIRKSLPDALGTRYGPWLDLFTFHVAPASDGKNTPITDNCQ